MQIVSAWLWLSNRFEQEMFPGKEAAEKLSQQLIDRMHESLQAHVRARERQAAEPGQAAQRPHSGGRWALVA